MAVRSRPGHAGTIEHQHPSGLRTVLSRTSAALLLATITDEHPIHIVVVQQLIRLISGGRVADEGTVAGATSLRPIIDSDHAGRRVGRLRRRSN